MAQSETSETLQTKNTTAKCQTSKQPEQQHPPNTDMPHDNQAIENGTIVHKNILHTEILAITTPPEQYIESNDDKTVELPILLSSNTGQEADTPTASPDIAHDPNARGELVAFTVTLGEQIQQVERAKNEDK